jgi:hypothetical protein
MTDDEAPKVTPRRMPHEWAETKGLAPQFVQVNGSPRGNPAYWKFAAAMGHMKWPSHSRITEQEFDDGVKAALSTR